MALTVTQANQVNTLLDWLLNKQRGWPGDGGRRATFGDARAAAIDLADAANKSLMAGLNGNRVAELWDTSNAAGTLRRKRQQVAASRRERKKRHDRT